MAALLNHQPVLLDEAVQALSVRPDGAYVDATFGRGGHSRAILPRLSDAGRLLVIDRDPQALAVAYELAEKDPRVSVQPGAFGRLKDMVVESFGAACSGVDGVLLDLGVSSPQVDDARRGFSFMHDGPLDMRMDNSSGVSAADWLAQATEQEMAEVFWRYGEERNARRMARAIVERRQRESIRTTGQLAELAASINKKIQTKHPATRIFQAIRIHINKELEQLERVLPQAVDVLRPGGRLVVISFHSLEDRIVKRFLRRQAAGRFDRRLPVPVAVHEPVVRLVGKAIKAGSAELQRNPRARSAVMRVAEKI